MTQTPPECRSCALWKAAAQPARGEGTEYLSYRPCRASTRPRFRGGQIQSRTKLLTAPTAGCDGYLGTSRGGER